MSIFRPLMHAACHTSVYSCLSLHALFGETVLVQGMPVEI